MTGQRRLRAVTDRPGHRAVLYRRVSAVMGRSGEEFLSPDLQLAAMRDLAGRRGLSEVAVVDDIDVSGRTFHRDGIQRVLAMARRGEIDVVAFYDLARLGRNVRESLRVIEELRELGVAVMSANEQIDDSPEGQFQLTIWLGLAQLYSDQVGRRWREVHAHRAQRGLLHASKVPVGYRRSDRPGAVMEPDPAWAPRIVEVFERYAAGESKRSIRRDFQDRFGVRMAESQVRSVLANPVYVGRIRFRGQELPGAHVAIVGERLWRRVQRRREADRDIPARAHAVTWPLLRLLVCDGCDEPMQKHAARQPNGKLVVRALCRRQAHWTDCPGAGNAPMGEVETAVLEQLAAKVAAAGFMVTDSAEAAERRARRVSAKADAARLRRQISDTERAMGRLTADRARRVPGLSETAFTAAMREFEEAVAGLRRQLALAETSVESPAPRVARKAVEELLALWSDPHATAEDRRLLLLPLVRQVRLRQAAFWREPVSDRVEVLTTWE